MNSLTVIRIQPAAPVKPAWGASCNGCGVCCLVETCPIGWIRSGKRRGPCKALIWDDTQARYFCGVVLSTQRWAAKPGFSWFKLRIVRWVHRRIAAGVGCDCSYEIQI